MKKLLLAIIASLVLLGAGCDEARYADGGATNTPQLGGLVTKPYNFTPNTTIRSSEINANFDTLYSLVNGQISNTNIASNAAIDRAKINGTAIVSTGLSTQSITSNLTVNGGFFVNTVASYFRVPVMTQAQRNALTAENGAMVYTSDQGQFSVYESGNWVGITPVGVTAVASTTAKGVVQEATDADLAAGTAVGSTGARLYAGSASFRTSSTANKVPVAGATGKIDLGWIDTDTMVGSIATTTGAANKIPIADANGNLPTKTLAGHYLAGEDLSALNAVYLNSADGKVYKTTSTVEGIFRFIGFVSATTTANNTTTVYTKGLVSGFTNLYPGADYFVTTTANITTSSAGNRIVRAGTAISSTTIQIKNDGRMAIITGTQVNTTTEIGFSATKATVFGYTDSTDGASISNGVALRNGVSYSVSYAVGQACGYNNSAHSSANAYALALYGIGTSGSCYTAVGEAGHMTIADWTSTTVRFVPSGNYKFKAIFEE